MFLLLGTSLFGYAAAQAYSSLGCWNDAPPGEIQAIRWSVNISATVADPVATCYNTAVNTVYPRLNVFGLQQIENDPTVLRCSYQADVFQNGTYAYYGPSTACSPAGTGSVGVNHVYRINGRASMSADVWESRGLISYGCFKTNPGPNDGGTTWNLDPVMDPFARCADRARWGFSGVYFREHPTLPTQNYQCSPIFDSFPGGAYTSLGASAFCRADGYGDKGIMRVFSRSRNFVIPRNMMFYDFENLQNLNTPAYNYSSLGCTSYTGSVPPQFNFRYNDPGMFSLISGSWNISPGYSAFYFVTIEECYQLALQRGHNIFFIVGRRFCASTVDVIPFPRPMGTRMPCPTDNLNSTSPLPAAANGAVIYQSFQIFTPALNLTSLTTSPNWTHMGCYNFPNTNLVAGVVLNEGNSTLTGDPSLRVDAIGKCSAYAKSIGHSFFIMRKGGQCLSTTTATTITSRGVATDCLADLRGASAHKLSLTTRFPNGGVNLFQVVP